jgi:hypothetical protein
MKNEDHTIGMAVAAYTMKFMHNQTTSAKIINTRENGKFNFSLIANPDQIK